MKCTLEKFLHPFLPFHVFVRACVLLLSSNQTIKGFNSFNWMNVRLHHVCRTLVFIIFLPQTHLFQRCLLKKTLSVSRGQVLADEWGGWRSTFPSPLRVLPSSSWKHVLNIVFCCWILFRNSSASRVGHSVIHWRACVANFGTEWNSPIFQMVWSFLQSSNPEYSDWYKPQIES